MRPVSDAVSDARHLGGYYQSHEVGPDYNVIIAETPTQHLEDRLRITRRMAGAIFTDGFESGDLSAWSSAG